MALCVSAGFEPDLAATVNDIGTAIGLVGIGWGVTIVPELTPAGTNLPVARIPISGVDTVRHSILIVRDGEHLSPCIAASITAVRGVSAQRWRESSGSAWAGAAQAQAVETVPVRDDRNSFSRMNCEVLEGSAQSARGAY
jgi:hypothetical protein